MSAPHQLTPARRLSHASPPSPLAFVVALVELVPCLHSISFLVFAFAFRLRFALLLFFASVLVFWHFISFCFRFAFCCFCFAFVLLLFCLFFLPLLLLVYLRHDLRHFALARVLLRLSVCVCVCRTCDLDLLPDQSVLPCDSCPSPPLPYSTLQHRLA